MNLAVEKKIVPLINSANISAGVDGDSINMAKGHRALIIVMLGTLGADSATLKVYSGVSNGAKTSALTYKYAVGSAAVGSASADVLGTPAAVASLTLTNTLHGNKMIVLEIDADQMDTNNDENWLTLEISSGASSGVCHAVAIIEPRYNDKATILA